ncbi:hypothetical protein [Luteimonas deserti]|uniref:Uncharacterized protein n=1 Tax=Luteimonas deserti TaxID=2752306 RepID=A0A7Z0QPW6_9GAMM|nr:hypothetical protein [Luteimonas deserti]NYZ62649.1 hypothetical protein [Luteimonas deserti]
MVRSIFAVVVGMLVATTVMLGLEFVAAWLVPLPAGELGDEADLAARVAAAPLGKLAWVLAGWLVAAFAGGWVAARLSRVHRRPAALAVGALIVLGVAINVWLLPHPLWMILAGLAAPLPLAWLGGRLATRP